MFKNKRIIINSSENNGLNPIDIKVKKQSFITRIFKLIIWIILIYIAIIYFGYKDFKTEILIKTDQKIQIKQGELINDLAEKLDINKTYLKIYLKNNNPEFELIVGSFLIKENSNIEDILITLEKPIIENEIKITTLEGWNIYDTDEYLTNKGLINKGEYINYVTNSEKIKALNEFYPFIESLETLEGFLYPDTYSVLGNNFKINNFVIKQLDNFEIKVYNEILKDLSNSKVLDLINLSSIVEKEERNTSEKSTVAGILKKRLNEGWMIGADITVCYPYKLTANECKLVISKYINEKSEYNTRTMKGLPKTPIGSPSFETINATLNSKNTNYWFYLHNTTSGKIYYAETNQEHEDNKKYMY